MILYCRPHLCDARKFSFASISTALEMCDAIEDAPVHSTLKEDTFRWMRAFVADLWELWWLIMLLLVVMRLNQVGQRTRANAVHNTTRKFRKRCTWSARYESIHKTQNCQRGRSSSSSSSSEDLEECEALVWAKNMPGFLWALLFLFIALVFVYCCSVEVFAAKTIPLEWVQLLVFIVLPALIFIRTTDAVQKRGVLLISMVLNVHVFVPMVEAYKLAHPKQQQKAGSSGAWNNPRRLTAPPSVQEANPGGETAALLPSRGSRWLASAAGGGGGS